MAHAGSVGNELDLETACRSAALAMVCTLANLKGALDGSLDRIDRFVRLSGYVRCLPDFMQLPNVMARASEVLEEIFGDELLPARTAIGVSALPGGASVELDTIVRLKS